MGSSSQQSASQTLASASEIDRSCRWPVLYLFGAAIGWLVLSLVFGVISCIKMHSPAFLVACPYVGFGRIRPLFLDLALYGFASQAALGAALWIFARLGRKTLVLPGLAALGGVVWNAGVTVGLIQLLFGGTTGLNWMEFPRQAAALLAGGFFLIAISAFYTLHERGIRELFVSQWFIVAGLLVFPWLLTAGYMLGVIDPVRGVMQAVVAAWFGNGIQYLWLTPMGLAVAYYLLPKLTGQPVYSNQAAALGFWVLIIFGSWSGVSQLAGGPFPRWITSVGVSSRFVLVLSAVCFGVNWFLTRRGAKPSSEKLVGASFVSFAVLAFLVASVLDAIQGIPSVALRTGLTPFSSGVTLLWLFGFVTMVLLGSIYHITERLLDVDWANSRLIKLHFVLSAIGVLLMTGAYLIGGVIFGSKLNDPTVAFSAAAKSLVPFLGMGTLGASLLLLGQLTLTVNFMRTVIQGTAESRAAFCNWCCGCGSASADKKARARA